MADPSEMTVHRRTEGDVAVLTIDDPPTRNALSAPTLTGLVTELEAIDRDPAVQASVIAGAGRFFASGANLRELRATSPAEYLTGPRQEAWGRLGRIEKPVVAAVAGFAFGGGCELALACDVVVAGDDARFGQPEVSLGLIPGAGGTQRWGRTVGRYRAVETVLAGTPMTAWEALRSGVVAQVVPWERTTRAGIAFAHRLSAGAPLAVRFAKRAVRLSEEMPIGRALEHERTLLAALLATDDLQEGVTAFLERRAPTFAGR